MNRVPLLLVVVACLAGCAADAPKTDHVDPTPTSSTNTATPPPSATPSASASPIGSAQPAAGLPTGDACEADADCAVSYAFLIDDKCCKGTCSPAPVSTSTLAAIDGACTTRGYEEQHCPMKKCVAPNPVGCRDHHCVFLPRTGPVVSADDAAERAVAAANPALDKAYAKYSAKPGVVAPTHAAIWVDVANARVTAPDAKGTWTVSFDSTPPAGFSHEAVVLVAKDGKVTVSKATASFSPD